MTSPSRSRSRPKGDLTHVLEDEARLEALRQTSLLDSQPEETFDRLTRLATAVLHVPVAIISLIASDRQFIKSESGLSGPLTSLRKTPLEHSFCKHPVGSGEPLVIADARKHPLVGHYPGVTELGIGAYAGIPLVNSEGHALGTFCVLD